MTTSAAMTKERFFTEGFHAGKTFKQLDKEWRESPYAIKRGHSVKHALEEAFLNGEIMSRAECDDFIKRNGTENDVKFSAEYWRQCELALKAAAIGINALKEMRA